LNKARGWSARPVLRLARGERGQEFEMRTLLLVLACLLLVLVVARWAGGVVFPMDDELTFAFDIGIGVIGLFLSVTVLTSLPERNKS
jgi:hypothetical protein